MPRDANGNYTLPAGNPVVSGTPISSSVQNATMSDVAVNLTDSLSRSGKGGMLAPLSFGDGTAANPAITFTAELTTGIYRSGSGEWSVTVLGTQVFAVAADGIYSRQPFYEWDGAQFTPLLNSSADYTIDGDWDFTQVLTLNGAVQASKGRYTYHDDAALPSSAIFISDTAPTGPEGADGDIWYQLEP
jgi:hypothetical protein